MAREVWAKLVYPNIPDELNRFEVSTYGKLRNAKTGHIYKQEVLSSGYCSVRTTIGKRNQKAHIIIHKAIAYTFLKNPDNLPEVNHKDGNRLNNNLSNLEWSTSHDNQQHKYNTGLFDKSKISGENNHSAKLTWEDVHWIRDNYQPGVRGLGMRKIAKKFGVSYPTIKSLIEGKTWKE